MCSKYILPGSLFSSFDWNIPLAPAEHRPISPVSPRTLAVTFDREIEYEAQPVRIPANVESDIGSPEIPLATVFPAGRLLDNIPGTVHYPSSARGSSIGTLGYPPSSAGCEGAASPMTSLGYPEDALLAGAGSSEEKKVLFGSVKATKARATARQATRLQRLPVKDVSSIPTTSIVCSSSIERLFLRRKRR